MATIGNSAWRAWRTCLDLVWMKAEKHVSDMVSDSGLYAKIDRPQGIIVFAKPQSPDEVLQDWASDISKMLSLVETTSSTRR